MNREFALVLASAALSVGAFPACSANNGLADGAAQTTSKVDITGGPTGDGNTQPAPGPQGPPTFYYQNVKPIMDARCANCHVVGGIGPFTLTSYADAKKYAVGVGAAVASGVMPPWMPDDACNTYRGDFSLTAKQKATIVNWVSQGAPEGDPSVKPDALDPNTPLETMRVDLEIPMPKPYMVQTQPDEYRCFVIPWTATTTKYVTGFQVKAGNGAVVHHAIVDIIAPNNAASIQAKEGADGKPGFTCGVQGASLDWLGAWAPGGQAQKFSTPTLSVGTKLVPGNLLVLQMHYHVEGSLQSAAPDQSIVQLELADSVQREGSMKPMLNFIWALGQMPIPANNPNVTVGYSASASIAIGAGQAIYSVATHMHFRGKIGRISVTRNGADQCLLNIPKWNFHWQNGYALTTPYVIQANDTFNLMCSFDNSAANQPVINGQKSVPMNLNWGEGSNDEMCLGIIYTAPAP